MRRGSTSSTGNLGRVQTRHVDLSPVRLHRRLFVSWFRVQNINLIGQEGQPPRPWHHDVSSSSFIVQEPRHVGVRKTPSLARHRGGGMQPGNLMWAGQASALEVGAWRCPSAASVAGGSVIGRPRSGSGPVLGPAPFFLARAWSSSSSVGLAAGTATGCSW